MNERASLDKIHGLSIKDVTFMPHPVELGRWREAGLIDIDVDRGIFVLTEVGKQRLRSCCAACGSWKLVNLPNAAGRPIGECHHEERLGDGMRRLRPPLSYHYETCEVFWPRPAQGDR